MTLPTADICYEAIKTRDSNYDGQFVVAVKTTKIYCRPSCPARTPKQENVTFFTVPAAAESHGFRACKRCHPKETNPVDEQALRVQEICEYIQTHVDESLTLEDLSTQVYWSPFHLQRTFKNIMGISPRQYVEVQRMNHFKNRLKVGDSVTNAALDAGYSSSSRVYAQTDARMGMPPSIYQNGGTETTIAYSVTDSPLGQLLLAMTGRGVCAVEMGDNESPLIAQLHKEFPQAEIVRDDDALKQAVQSVVNYLKGWQPHIDLPLDIRVTAFQQRVLDELKRIPYGETRTYGEIAKAIGQPKAARAVGNACNKNPVPIIIPCHRVVGSNGKLTGYAFGLERKKTLLDLEKNAE
ncbi:MAG: bifunctional DNA-binding transcriptional regulator/O6-methylguanine-DNA methyltransferase Ada [Anaerolineae bacterium]|nr:bifunctional DNA-binding transcriptional regulator/O6-methylguanine-DNA methyltransferase Ada [Anaerolineae bacterium]MDQ7033779.1 bifunctional DNA-binding transcriptional regulator/O6-methylguanine-DNA methyltransferase Ada [Anaerolineae bacterium]